MMTNPSILINDNEVRLVKMNRDNRDEFKVITEVKHLRTDDFYSRLFKEKDIQSDILPKNCRFYKQAGDYDFLIIEEPPSVRNIKVDLSFDNIIENLKNTGKLEEYGYTDFLKNEPPYYFNLSFPYIVFFITFKNSCFYSFRTFFRLHQMSSFHDYLLLPNLTNINNNFNVCLGNHTANEQSKSLSEKVEELISAFWCNEYNADYTYMYDMYSKVPELSSFLHWEYNTSVDPMFIFGARWLTHERNVISELSNLVENFKQNESNNDHLFNKSKQIISGVISSKLDTENISSTCNSYAFLTAGNSYILSIGDEVIINDETHYIYEFLGTLIKNIESKETFIEPKKVSGVLLENENGAIVNYKITDPVLVKAVHETYKEKELV